MSACSKHGGASHFRSGPCQICAIENQTREIISAISKIGEHKSESSIDKIALNPFCWHEIKTGANGDVYVRMVPDSEIYIKPPKKSLLEIMRELWK